MLNAKRLEILAAIAEHKSFSAAADVLAYTQSAVSQHIAALERETGLTLIERAARPLQLTDAGAQLLEDATPGLEHLRRAERRLRDLAELRTGRIRIGAFPTANAVIVPSGLAAFRAKHPDIKTELEEAEPSAMLSALREGQLDLAIVYTIAGRAHAFGAPIALRPLIDDPLVAVLPPGHRLARRRAVRLADLADEQWVAAKPPNDFRTLFDQLCAEARFTPQIAVETSDPSIGLTLAQAGIGTMLIPALALHAHPTIKPLSVLGIPAFRTICTATISGRRHPAINALSDAIAKAAHDVERRQPAAPARLTP
jgi:DNA-binding transcriptional LysR family regulator